MLSEVEIRAIGQQIVNKSKRTAHVDTGALKRSISFTYVKEVLIFRELYYGQWNGNSKLEINARNLVPRGVEWKIIYTKFGGNTYEVGRTRQGRATQKSGISSLLTSVATSVNLRKLLARRKNKNNGKTQNKNTN